MLRDEIKKKIKENDFKIIDLNKESLLEKIEPPSDKTSIPLETS